MNAACGAKPFVLSKELNESFLDSYLTPTLQFNSDVSKKVFLNRTFGCCRVLPKTYLHNIELECIRNLPLCIGGDLCLAVVTLRDCKDEKESIAIKDLKTVKIGNSKRTETITLKIERKAILNSVTFICVCVVPNEKLRKLPMDQSPSKIQQAALPLSSASTSEHLQKLLLSLYNGSSESNTRHFTHIGMLDIINRGIRMDPCRNKYSLEFIRKMQPYVLNSNKGPYELKLVPVRHLEQSFLTSNQLSSYLAETTIAFEITSAIKMRKRKKDSLQCNNIQNNCNNYKLNMCNNLLKDAFMQYDTNIDTRATSATSALLFQAKQKAFSSFSEVFHHYYYTSVLLNTDIESNTVAQVASIIDRCNTFRCPFCKSFSSHVLKSSIKSTTVAVERNRLAYRLCAHLLLNHSTPYFKIAFNIDEYNCLHIMYFPVGTEGKLGDACMTYPTGNITGPPKICTDEWIHMTNKPVIKYNKVLRGVCMGNSDNQMWYGFYHMNTTIPMTTSQTISYLKYGTSIYNIAPCCKEHYQLLPNGTIITNPLCYNCIRPSTLLFNNYTNIDEYSDISMEEKLFMKLWNHNLYITSCTNIKSNAALTWESVMKSVNIKNNNNNNNNEVITDNTSSSSTDSDCIQVSNTPYDDNNHTFAIYGDCYMGLVCQNFLIMYKQLLIKHGLRQVLLMHLLHLLDNNLIVSRDIVQFMQYFDV